MRVLALAVLASAALIAACDPRLVHDLPSPLPSNDNQLCPAEFAPRNLTAVPRVGSVHLSFTPASGGFRTVIERSHRTDGFLQVGDVDPGVSAYDDADAAADDEFQYRATSKSSSCESTPTAAVVVDTLSNAPGALVVQTATETSLALSFTDTNENETGYVASATPQGASSEAAQENLPSNATSATFDGLTPDTGYDIVVAGVSSSGDGAPAHLTAFTLASAPTNVSATVDRLALAVSFDANATHATHMLVVVSDPTNATVQTTTTLDPSARTASVPIPADGTTLTVAVSVENPGGVSLPGSTTVAVPCLSGVGANSVVATSTAIVGDAAHANIHVAFASDAPPSYTFTGTASPLTGGATVVGSATGGARALDLVAPRDTAFSLSLAGVGAGSAACAVDAAAVLDVTSAPFDVTGLVATAAADGVHLSWSDANTTETGLLVRRTRIADATVTEQDASAGATSFTDVTAAFDDFFDYDVIAVGPSGQSSATTTTVATLPAPPADVTVTTEGGTLHVRWTNTSTTATQVRLERASFGTTAFATLATLGANASDYVDTPPDAAAYTYRVSAVSPAGANASAASGSLACDASLALTNLAVSLSSNDSIHLTFSPSSSGLATRIQRAAAGSSQFADVLVTGTGATSADDTAAPHDAVLQYRARGETGVCTTAFTAPVSIDSAPNVVTVTAARDPADATHIDLSWSDTNTLETGYRVERQTPAGSGAFSALATLAANATSFVDTSPEPGEASAWRVVSINPSAERASAAATRRPAPLPPTNAGVAGRVNAVLVTWANPASGVAQGFEVVADGIVMATPGAGTTQATVPVGDDLDHAFLVRSTVSDGGVVRSIDASAGSAHRHRAPSVSFTSASITADNACAAPLPGVVTVDGGVPITSNTATSQNGTFTVASTTTTGVAGHVTSSSTALITGVTWNVTDALGLSNTAHGSWLLGTTAATSVTSFVPFSSGFTAGNDLAAGHQPLTDQPGNGACAACVGKRASILVTRSYTALLGADDQVWVSGQLASTQSLLTPLPSSSGALVLVPDNETFNQTPCWLDANGALTCFQANGLGGGALSSVGGNFVCTISNVSEPGKVSCFGNDFTALGNNGGFCNGVCTGNGAPIFANMLAASGRSTCAVSGGALFCWGSPVLNGQTAQPEGNGPIEALAAGLSDQYCAVSSSGSVGCFGFGNTGGGSPSFDIAAVNVAVDECVCAIDANGVVECQAEFGGGQRCEGTHPSFNNKRICLDAACTSTIDDAVAISTGGDSTCAVTLSHGVLCWGDNSEGQLGSGDTQSRVLPQPMCASGSGPSCPAFELAARRTCGTTTLDPLF